MNRNRLLLTGLVLSVAINLFLIGGIGYRVNVVDEFSARPLPPNVTWMVRDLSEERRAQLRPLMEQSDTEIRPMRRAMFDAQRRVNELMADPDYDANALESAFTELLAANLRYQEMSHRHSVSMLNELTEQERAMAVEFINRRGPREGRDRRFMPGDRPFEGRSGIGPGPGRPPQLEPPVSNQ